MQTDEYMNYTMDTQEYMDRLFMEINSITDAFCNGAEKCKTNEEAYEFLREWYYENIIAYLECPYIDGDEDFNNASQQEAERFMLSMIERVIKHPYNTFLNKKSVRFLRHFAKIMYNELFTSEEERLTWEHDNMLLGI